MEKGSSEYRSHSQKKLNNCPQSHVLSLIYQHGVQIIPYLSSLQEYYEEYETHNVADNEKVKATGILTVWVHSDLCVLQFLKL